MAAHHEVTDLLENIRKELPERVHDVYEEAVQQAMKKGRQGRKQVARQMLRHNPWLHEEYRRQQEEEGALAIFMLILGFVAGAALMYLFDPERGEQRRAQLGIQANRMANDVSHSVEESTHQVRSQVNRVADEASDSLEQASDQARSKLNQAAGAVENTSRQVANQAKSATSEAKNRVEETASDAALIARVRVELVRSVRTPAGIEVTAHNGTVTLTGKVRASEVQPLIEKIQALTGVKTVENRLEIHDAPDTMSSQSNNLNTTPSTGT